MTLLTRLDQVPPFVLYYLARNGKSSMIHPGLDGIAAASGLSKSTVMRLSQSLSWKGVKVGTLDTFCSAVGAQFVRQTGSRFFQREARSLYACRSSASVHGTLYSEPHTNIDPDDEPPAKQTTSTDSTTQSPGHQPKLFAPSSTEFLS